MSRITDIKAEIEKANETNRTESREYFKNHLRAELTNGIPIGELETLCEAWKSGNIMIMPFVAMIEQTLIDGKFSQKKKDQAFNGRYAVVYSDKSKWSSPLIDICGDAAYNPFESQRRIADMRDEAAALKGEEA